MAGDELVPQLARAGAAHDGAQVERAHLVKHKTMGPGRFCRHFGGGRVIRPSLCMASMVTRAIMSLSPPSGLNQPTRRQNSFDRVWRFSAGGPAINARNRPSPPA